MRTRDHDVRPRHSSRGSEMVGVPLMHLRATANGLLDCAHRRGYRRIQVEEPLVTGAKLRASGLGPLKPQ